MSDLLVVDGENPRNGGFLSRAIASLDVGRPRVTPQPRPPTPPSPLRWSDYPAGYVWADHPTGLTWNGLLSLKSLGIR